MNFHLGLKLISRFWLPDSRNRNPSQSCRLLRLRDENVSWAPDGPTTKPANVTRSPVGKKYVGGGLVVCKKSGNEAC